MGEPYELLPEDEQYLNAHYAAKWRRQAEGGSKFGLVVSGFAMPEGYSEREATLMLLVPSGYPDVPIDMFYFNPSIQRQDGAAIDATMQLGVKSRS